MSLMSNMSRDSRLPCLFLHEHRLEHVLVALPWRNVQSTSSGAIPQIVANSRDAIVGAPWPVVRRQLCFFHVQSCLVHRCSSPLDPFDASTTPDGRCILDE